MNNFFSGKLFLHIVSLTILLLLAAIYCKPIFEKKRLVQHDLVQATGAAQEADTYYKKNGTYPLWTNSMFGGMPAYTVKAEYPNSWTSKVSSYVSYILPDPLNYLFMLLLGFYIAMAALGNKPLISLLGAVAFGFSSYSLISLEAGHASKVLAIAFAAPLSAGIVLLYRGDYLKGALLTGIFMMLELYSNHIQITYYLAIALVIYALIEGIRLILAKQVKQFVLASVIILGISGVLLGSMATRFWVMYEYQQYTIRGPSELTPIDGNEAGADVEAGTGLAKAYAFNWSYGKGETFNYLIPDFNGGKGGAALSPGSEVYETIMKYKFGKKTATDLTKAEQWPIYWGVQPGTSGPAYMGIVISFLAVLALFIIKDTMKWWMLGIIVFFSMLAWGNNYTGFNYFIFDHFPLYNKFRAVTMIHALVAMFIVWLAVWGLQEVLKTDKQVLQKYLKISIGGLGGLMVVFWLFGSSMLTFEKMDKRSEEQIEEARAKGQPDSLSAAENEKRGFISSWTQASQNPAFASDLYDAVVADRQSAFSSDAFRSLVFILLAGALLYAYAATDYLKADYLLIGLLALVLFDEWQVSKRYLNDADFKKKKSIKSTIVASSADNMILEDKDPDFRVYNVTVSTFNDATTSFYHKSIGGYSAAKLRRYQDIIERQISNNNMNVLNMLNTKYFIMQNPQDGKPVAQKNPEACGHAWLVTDFKVAKTADEEMKMLDSLKPKESAIITEAYYSKLAGFKPQEDSTATIELTSYAPDHLSYTSEASSPQMAVFSEIYYNSGLGWNAFIDGKPVDHVRVDYILRGMQIPAGKHTIEFKFEPQTYAKGEKVSLICSILFTLSLIGVIYLSVKKERSAAA